MDNIELTIRNGNTLYYPCVEEGIIWETDRKSSPGKLSFNVLVDTIFSTDNPLIRINSLSNQTERSEHIGLSNLIKGVFGLIRNPTAHDPKIKFSINEEEALDILTTISYIHKRLDLAIN